MSEQKVTGAKVKRVVLEDGQLVVTGTRNQEYELVVSLNHETAQKIMETALKQWRQRTITDALTAMKIL